MGWNAWGRYFVELLLCLPAGFLCLAPVKGRLRVSMGTFLWAVVGSITAFAAVGALVIMLTGWPENALLVPDCCCFLVVLSLDRGGTSPGGVHFSAGCGGDGVLRSHYGCVDGPGGGSQSRHSAYADRSGIATGIGDVDGGADVAAHGQSGRLAGGTLHAGERVANRMGIAPGAYAAVYRDDAGRLPYDIGQPGTTAGRDYFGVSVGVDGVSHRAVLPNCALDKRTARRCGRKTTFWPR